MSNKIEVFIKVKKNYLGLGLKSIDILILSQVEEFQRNGCLCYMTNKQFSEMFGESESTVKRSIEKLEKLNIIQRETNVITDNGQKSKQRVMAVYDISQWNIENKNKSEESKVQKITKQGSNLNEVKVKNNNTKVHNEPIKDNLKEKIKYNSKSKEAESIKESSYTAVEDLTYSQGDDICARLARGESYISVANLYNIKPGTITKAFPEKWAAHKKHQFRIAEQQREWERYKNEPHIDYTAIAKAARQSREKEEAEKREHDEMVEKAMEEIWGEDILSHNNIYKHNKAIVKKDLSEVADAIYTDVEDISNETHAQNTEDTADIDVWDFESSGEYPCESLRILEQLKRNNIDIWSV